MSAIKVNVSGEVQVSKKLTTLLTQKQKALIEAVEITQAVIVNDAKGIVPVKTGFLRNSINPGKVEFNSSSGTADGSVSADAEYASHVEFGTSRQKAQPYLIPSVMKNRSGFLNRVKAAMQS